ncbi:PREDICTED: CASP-like protein PIMP1 [Nicotiana attenuata]|uniref:CASP-like protein n=1 Tax=Nicotiana attenuata TaxID=49451 RepID=A0A314KQ13_NICAT|nr:PREDICTED: CASP-like protein PIMP1 [Nicotiana attenuata]OIT31521.1 casp-like protein pimp1 [Nicotiana attenuata]
MGCLTIVNLLLRIVSLCCLATSITILTTASSHMSVASLFHKDVEVKFGFSDFYAYRYMLACAAAGFVYSLLQTAFAIIQVKTGDCVCDKLIHFDVYADKIMSMIVGTGAAAGFGLTVDLNCLPNRAMITVDFLNKENVAASFCLGGFVCTMISSFISLKIFKDDYLYEC